MKGQPACHLLYLDPRKKRLGDRLYRELDLPFIQTPDAKDEKSIGQVSPKNIRDAWQAVNHVLGERIDSLPTSDWLERHNDVSPDDFLKDPLRNRLAVLISRTIHVSYHTGPIRLAR